MLKLDLWKLLLDLKSIASDILQYIFEPAEWIRYIAIYFNLPSECDTWPADISTKEFHLYFLYSPESRRCLVGKLKIVLVCKNYSILHVFTKTRSVSPPSMFLISKGLFLSKV